MTPTLLNKSNPIKYPNIPPITEDKVQIVANKKALVFFARTIGIKTISGGIGKKELSANAITLRNQGALFEEDFFRVQL